MTRIENISILGVGLIGASFALALKENGFTGKILGCDTPAALRAAGERGALDASAEDPIEAVRKSQLIVLAAPVRANLKLLETIAPHVAADALITDVGSTKRDIHRVACELFGENQLRRLLPGHPMAGKELSGAQHADAGLFRGAAWVLTPPDGKRSLIAPEFSRGLHREFMKLLESIGARIVVTTPGRHDVVLAYTSHLPQMVSTALASTVQAQLGGRPELRDLSGRGLREMIRLAKSDPQLWNEIAASNQDEIKDALNSMEQALRRLREALGTPEFERLFREGRALDPDAEPAATNDTDPPRFD